MLRSRDWLGMAWGTFTPAVSSPQREAYRPIASRFGTGVPGPLWVQESTAITTRVTSIPLVWMEAATSLPAAVLPRLALFRPITLRYGTGAPGPPSDQESTP